MELVNIQNNFEKEMENNGWERSYSCVGLSLAAIPLRIRKKIELNELSSIDLRLLTGSLYYTDFNGERDIYTLLRRNTDLELKDLQNPKPYDSRFSKEEKEQARYNYKNNLCNIYE